MCLTWPLNISQVLHVMPEAIGMCSELLAIVCLVVCVCVCGGGGVSYNPVLTYTGPHIQFFVNGLNFFAEYF